MEPTLDFSFHNNNPLAPSDDIESPKPMPSPPPLPLLPHDSDELQPDHLDTASLLPSSADNLEVIETLSISPAKSVYIVTPEMSPASVLPDSAPVVVSTPAPAAPGETQVSKPKPRAKVPLERGFTQMDWLRLTRTEPDLAGLKGMTNRRLIPLSEVKQHRSEDDAWTVLKGRVYNITPYLKFHPGGSDMLMKGSGKDCTTLFNKYHSWVNAEYLLEKCLVGFLDVEH